MIQGVLLPRIDEHDFHAAARRRHRDILKTGMAVPKMRLTGLRGVFGEPL